MRFLPEHVRFEKPVWDKKFAWTKVYLKDVDRWAWFEFVKRKRQYRTVETAYLGLVAITVGLVIEYYSINYEEKLKLEVVKNDNSGSDENK